ncbi:MAG TPA: DNA-processing protein DprA [Gemmatimonadaceae bacterium]|nr:DNA-processing protein DprA [Gemmatimonadaceae bacterium]
MIGIGDCAVIERHAAEYPPGLNDLTQPPKRLYAIGSLSALTPPCVAIVGTRDPTGYGLRMTRSIATGLSRAGVAIVSGLARGIDAAAHRAVLEAEGRTVAVLGTGVDVPYPASHRELHSLIGEKGLLISENAPGSAAYVGAFPKRNRIIAAVASVTIVVEAPAKSGALLTAEQALLLGRVLAAVPGPIDSPQSAGSNRLLRDGAHVITCVADALGLAGVSSETPADPPFHLSEQDALIWQALEGCMLQVDALAAKSGLTARDCLGAITSLELAGMVECLLTGEVRRR